ncbi:autotransporter assembly complex protein TamA [Rhizobiaceae bacterium n13]|uniref:Autotransporter assembly complex protein TamA n=1 Tax=Ferirhizobium litorale TaxID=2927786 RepID=A0AAE3U3B1_9HYPH|nr:autotransporter assembly complex family protein [Fererhizobium litorale]MDI7862506.1 autotransporter assembly complex protein TamA [Fererhizobium litorale]MDI7923607.1 autotransporter assembly complex protein TamA [Fererhizobium litorale]
MRYQPTAPKNSKAYRRAGTAIIVAALAAASPLASQDANAFKLFGINFFGSEDDSDEDRVIDPVRYSITFEVNTGDKKLRSDLEEASHLVLDKESPVSGDLGVVIKARDDRDRLVATLYEKARYGGVVTITVDGTEIGQLPPLPEFDNSRPVPVVVRIDPGPVFTFGDVTLTGDATGFNPANYDLIRGKEAGSLLILRAGDKVVSDLKAQGRPLARLTARDAIADHKTNTVDVTIAAAGGPIAPLGPVAVTGQKAVNPDFIRYYSRLNEGKPYSPDELRKAGDRLRQLGVFSSVNIQQASALDGKGQIPLTIQVSEAKQRVLGLGAQVSTIDGLGVQGYWGHRNLFGQAESLRIEGSVSRIGEASTFSDLDYSAGILFAKPGAFFPAATFNAGLVAKTEHPDTYRAATISATAGLSYEITDWDTVSGGLDFTWADTEDAFGDHTYLTLSLPFEYIRDTRDDKLNPTEGYRATLATQPSYGFLNSVFFSSFEGSISGYKAFGAEDNVVLAAKLGLGSIVGASDLEEIPTTRRFYAGGGGSVRGYAYQEISPYDSAGEATGGSAYAVGSFEARIKVTDTIGVVPFIDAGSVTDEVYPDFSDIRVGTGVGLRYATPFGPLRLDFAVPLNRYPGGSSFGIYAGIGQAF